MSTRKTAIAIVGAGIAGLATAWHLSRKAQPPGVTLLDCGAPLALTTAASGENYRTWWPQPELSALTARSLDLVELIAAETGNRPNLTRLGYVYATRAVNTDGFIGEQFDAYPHLARHIRVHTSGESSYRFDPNEGWERAPDGIDVVTDAATIARHFPGWDRAVTAFVHVRRAGDLSVQQLGQFMLETARARGTQLRRCEVSQIECVDDGFAIHDAAGSTLKAEQVVLAAGPFTASLAARAGASLPLECVYQQKIAFADTLGAVGRAEPFTIDLDPQTLDWSADERDELAADAHSNWLLTAFPAGVHSRPDGGRQGNHIKLGWAYAADTAEPVWAPQPLPAFKDVVLRGAARLRPALREYYEHLPRALAHYGGYYAVTPENLPLIGPTDVAGLHVVGGLGGFGTMAACAAGELSAAWLCGDAVPQYGEVLAPARYHNAALVESLRTRDTGSL